MEHEFASNVESQVFELSCLDMVLAMCNIPLVFIYGNEAGDEEFMPAESLSRSFYKTLQQFPILAGHVRDERGGRARIVVDKDNLNMPVYRESTSDVCYAELKAANFSWDKWPRGLALNEATIDVQSMDQIKLLTAHVVRLKANSGLALFLSIPHYAVDGYGYYAFLNRWAEICNDMRNGVDKQLSSYKAFRFDRKAIDQAIPEERTPLDDTTKKIYTNYSLMVKLLKLMPQLSLIRLIGMSPMYGGLESHMFHISQASLDELRSSVRGFVPNDMRISNNDLITAVLSKLIYQCNAQSHQPQSGFLGSFESMYKLMSSWLLGKSQSAAAAESNHQLAVTFCDMRHRIGIEHQSYVGNCIVGCYVASSVKSLASPITDEAVAGIAMNVRQLVSRLDGGYFGSLIDVISSDSLFSLHLAPFYKKHPMVVFSDHTRFKMNDADFGNGVQQWTSIIPRAGSDIVVVFKSHPKEPGVNAYVSTKARTMKRLLESEYWSNIAQLLC